MNIQDERKGVLAVTDLARRQYGLITRAQLESALTRKQIERRVRSGWLVRVEHGVWLLPGSPPSWRQGLMVPCLAYGRPVAASHVAAARLWGFEAVYDRSLHVTIPRNRSGQRHHAGVVAHRGRLEPHELADRYGLPVTSVIRTLVDLAATLTPDALGSAIDDALRRRILSYRDLMTYRQRDRRPVRGLAKMDRLVAARLESGLGDNGVGDSEWEDHIFDWIVGSGLPVPVRQHQVALPRGVAVLDLAYPDRLVGMEFDGWAWHRGRRRFDRDRARASELALAGWVVIMITSAHSKAQVLGWVRRALEMAGAP